MPSSYTAIKADNELRYGTDIGRIGPMLLANRYDDRIHFVYELLQNVEDALKRRTDWQGSRAVVFRLTSTELRVSHCGVPFTEQDVKGICGIGESTKEDLTAIGRFGIGFKSVYAYTNRPEIHSGDEHFAIDSYVWPCGLAPLESSVPDETVFVFPFEEGDTTALGEITEGLQQLGPRVLLFLREIEGISWSVEGGPSGEYLRDKPQTLSDLARKIVVISQESGQEEVDEETWLIFAREVQTEVGLAAGDVEIAFLLDKDKPKQIKQADESNLVVFFPTVLPTNLGFLVQGPYRTTPSRDNVPPKEPWNQHLAQETAHLLRDTLLSLRDSGYLSVAVLRTLPLEHAKFGEKSLFAPLFGAARTALSQEPLLPRLGGGYISAQDACLAETQGLRDLFVPLQLTSLLQRQTESAWLSEEITTNRAPELKRYLIQELGLSEVTPETILSKLTPAFLEAQSDQWVTKLYEFLHSQLFLLRQGRFGAIPLVRLQDGTHIAAKQKGEVQVFLPSSTTTDFPTVRAEVCATAPALAFLRALGLNEPDPVDDVIRNVLPRYRDKKTSFSGEEYAADIRRLLQAFATDSKTQREKLLEAMRGCEFVRVVDTKSGRKSWASPRSIYLPTQRFKDLFADVAAVYLVDDSLPFLRGEAVRDFLEACGAARVLSSLPEETDFSSSERREMRRKGSCEGCSGEESIRDNTFRGLRQLLAQLPNLPLELAARKAQLLWEALSDVQERIGQRAFSGTYSWFYYRLHSYEFDAACVRQLNSCAWVPGKDGMLHPPHLVTFKETGWTDNPFLLSKIQFKPPIIETLAREAGVDPNALDLLRKHGVTEAQLKAFLGIKDELPSAPARPSASTDVDKGTAVTNGQQTHQEFSPSQSTASTPRNPSGKTNEQEPSPDNSLGRVPHNAGANESAQKSQRSFISYVAVGSEQKETDPDGLEHEARMALEVAAIELILEQEPELQRAPTNNPGFDLTHTNARGAAEKWIEVKAMSSDLRSRPVTLSKTQFDWAREHGENFWLYIVENAASQDAAHVVRIQDPAGKARSFTFDHGWLCVAEGE